MEEIARWLRQPNDYNRGLDLYKTYGKSTALLVLFNTGESLFNKKKLITVLQDLHDAAHVSDIPDIPDIPHIPAAPKKQKVVLMPEEKEELVSVVMESVDPFQPKLKQLYTMQSASHVRLKLLYQLGHPQKELQALCFEILDIGKQIQSLLLLEDEYRTTGKIPEAMRTMKDLSPAEQYRRLLNNRSYITKYADVEDKQDEVEKRLKENYTLEDLLK